MSQPRQPRRPISPWPVGAAILSTFVALAIFFGDSTLAVEVMIALALAGGLLIMRTARRGQESSNSTAPTPATPGRRPGQRKPPSTAMSAVSEDPPPVLTVNQAAAYLQSDIATVTAELEAGQLPGNKLAGEWRLRRAALDAWLDGAYGAAAASRAP